MVRFMIAIAVDQWCIHKIQFRFDLKSSNRINHILHENATVEFTGANVFEYEIPIMFFISLEPVSSNYIRTNVCRPLRSESTINPAEYRY